MRPLLVSPALSALLSVAVSAFASPQDPGEVANRFEELAKARQVVVVDAGAAEKQDQTGPIEAGASREIMSPSVLSPADVVKVFMSHKKSLAECLQRQRAKDQKFAAKIIIDVAIRRTGRVAEMRIDPKSLAKQPLGECLFSAVPKWRFPSFTGEIDNGVSQEVVNASVPISFVPPR